MNTLELYLFFQGEQCHVINTLKSTPSHMVYGEVGIAPIEVDVKSRIISFWCKVSDNNSNKLSNHMYFIIHTLHEQGKLHSKWITYIKK